ncbi:MAG: CBS domain-containing protein [Calditrichaeota bacterium]|nr:MAG: CBS domain-containing protein [Calditrichota bacterium]
MAKSIQKMMARKIGCLLVVQDQKLRGIFTERDALMKIAGQNVDLDRVVIDDFMTPDPVRLHMHDTVEAALKLMVDRGYRHVSVVDENERPVAVVSIRDIVAYIVEFFPDDVLNLPPHPIRIGTKDREGG